MNNKIKKTVAVFFGAKSPEHDVSVVTGLQIIKAIDLSQFDVFPVYIAPNGDWLIGEELLEATNYMFNRLEQNKLVSVTLDLGSNLNKLHKFGRLLFTKSKLFSIKKFIDFDIAILALHGINSEDGKFAALMDIANVPYTGMRHFAATILMNKIAAKNLFKSVGISVLPHAIIERPNDNFNISITELEKIIILNKMAFPLCAKPCNLGSSIGVSKIDSIDELVAVLPNIFKYDSVAMLEPFVHDLVEYNVAVGLVGGKLVTSAIEEPICTSDLLNFTQKYKSGGDSTSNGSKFGSKTAIPSTGMLSMTRKLNPGIDPSIKEKILNWAKLAFTTVQGSGFPRIDFLSNSKTGEVWLNEVNPYPGSFGFYLWEASEHRIFFTELLNLLLEEAQVLHTRYQLPLDPTPVEARLFPRK